MNRYSRWHAVLTLSFLVVLLADLAACGRKGPLVAPVYEESEIRGSR
ncbi:MAG: hypothetical protein CFH37_00449 [Alphaproteobacteria bacterium MarineAlpha9_Bin7]|nr:MAG: hypothetical protein CFH37_00449 [Alphaproteobacteria bacterium MarineAlpha9_Bin7]